MRRTIPTLIGIAFLVVGVAAGVLLVQQRQLFRLSAGGDTEPLDVRITNVTDTSFTVSWTTSRETVGFVEYGEGSNLGTLANQEDKSPKYVHSTTIRELSPNTNYFFAINSGGQEYLNNNIPWSVQTGPSLPPQTEPLLISGTILESESIPADGIIVYVTTGGANMLSTVTSSNGSWIIPLSSSRTAGTLNDYANIDPESSVLDIFVQGGPLGIATAQAIPASANPTPNIVLGQSYDFRDTTGNEDDTVTESSLDLPEEEEVEPSGNGGFEIDEGQEQTGTNDPVSLESIDEDGEIIFTNKPQFFGSGPSNTEVIITVESTPQSGEITTSSSGQWSWTPSDELEEGTHTVTLTWRDAQGFLRTLSRQFIVQAQDGGPAFESTPSGTTFPTSTPSPSPTPSPTATPTPSPSPTLAPSPTPTPTDRVSFPATDSGVPVAGSLTPTLFMATMGLGLLGAGIFISKKAT